MGWKRYHGDYFIPARTHIVDKRLLTQKHLKVLLSYDPKTGIFRWRNRAGVNLRIPAGMAAGGVNRANGYHHISIAGNLLKSHQLAWLYMTGSWPDDELDHINRDRTDNHWKNLRASTVQQNMKNKNTYKSNTSGYAGVTWHSRIKMWQVRIGADWVRHHLGYYKSKRKAAAVYAQAKASFHGRRTQCS